MTDRVRQVFRQPLIQRMLVLAVGMLRLAGRVAADVAAELGHDAGQRIRRGELAAQARTERGLAAAFRVRHAFLAVLRYLKMPGRRVLYTDRQASVSIRAA